MRKGPGVNLWMRKGPGVSTGLAKAFLFHQENLCQKGKNQCKKGKWVEGGGGCIQKPAWTGRKTAPEQIKRVLTRKVLFGVKYLTFTFTPPLTEGAVGDHR